MTTSTAGNRANEAGFSLLEALIALAVLAIASASLVGASQVHLDSIDALEDRAIASWVAEVSLAEMRIGDAPVAASVATRDMAGRSWRVESALIATDEPELMRVDISVGAANKTDTLALLTGFIDVGPSS